MPAPLPLLSFEKTLEILRIPPLTDPGWGQDWDHNQARFPAGGLTFVQPSHIEKTLGLLRFSPSVTQVLVENTRLFEQYPLLQRLLWHLHRWLFLGSSPGGELSLCPLPTAQLHPAATLFNAYLLLSGLDPLKQLYHQRGLPEAVLTETLADLQRWILDHHRRTGNWGLTQFPWLMNHMRGELFSLGRLQFQFSHQEWGFHAFRNIENNSVIIFSGEAMVYDDQGQPACAQSAPLAPNTWRASFHMTQDLIQGHPIDPARGTARRQLLEIDPHQWSCILAPGDPVLAIHIPASGPMDHAACGHSFSQAIDFFGLYFKNRPFRAFTCDSWLLDSQLGDLLPADSNIVRFQREFYLLPLPGANNRQTYERVFGDPNVDITAAPATTRLQQVVKNHVLTGGTWRNTGCLLFPANLNWGTQIYRRR